MDGLQPLFETNGIDLDFYFKTLKPADFIDVDAVQAQTTDEQEKAMEEWTKKYEALRKERDEVVREDRTGFVWALYRK